MRLTQFRHLLATVEYGSIRGAARALDVAPPVITRSIRELEHELSVQLLERTAHGVVPTEAGRSFLARARIVQNELGRMREESAQRSGSAATVTFGYGPPSMPVLPPALASFRREYPSARVRMVVGLPPKLLPQLREGRIEFAIGPLLPGWTDKYFKTCPLYRSERAIVGRPGHPLRDAKSLAELSGADWLLYGDPSEAPKDPAGKAQPNVFEPVLPAPRSVTYCTDGADYLNLLVQTDMLGAVNRQCMSHGCAGRLLEAFPVKLPLPPPTIHVFVRGDSPLTPAAAAMVSAIKREARRFNFSGREAGRKETSVTTAALV